MSAITEQANQRTVIFQTDHFEVVRIEWSQDQFSKLHNHGFSQCAVLIETGIFENLLDLGNKSELQIFEAGQVINTPVGARHEIRCLSANGRTMHAYMPKIKAHEERGLFTIPGLDQLLAGLKLGDPMTVDELRKATDSIRDASVTTHSPYFMNQLFSGISPQMLIAETLIHQTKSSLATFEAAPLLASIESEVIAALGRRIGWEEDQCEGVSVPGGSAANFMALHCARQKLAPDSKSKGMQNSNFRIYVSEEAHYSFKKAAVVLGFGLDNVITIASDGQGRMDLSNLAQTVERDRQEGFEPIMVVATAGTTVLGVFDPIDAMGDFCEQQKIWLHIDAAWGGPAFFSKQLQAQVFGAHKANSLGFDAHKLFGASLTTALFLTREKGILLASNDVSGPDYLFHAKAGDMDRGKLSWQCGRGADAVSFWCTWKSLGDEGLGSFVDKLLQIRDEVLPWIAGEPRLQLVAEPEYLNICVRILPPDYSQDARTWSMKVRESLKQENLAMVNYSEDQNGSFLRLILAHPYLHCDHVKQILKWGLAVT